MAFSQFEGLRLGMGNEVTRWHSGASQDPWSRWVWIPDPDGEVCERVSNLKCSQFIGI